MARIPTWIAVVAGAIEDREGRLLMQRRPLHKQHGGLWEFPGGKVEPGETPRRALVRELNEELRIAIDPATARPLVFAETPPQDGHPGIVILLYRICDWKGVPRADEDAQIGWFAPDSIRALPLPPLDSQLLETILATEQ